MVQWSLRVLVLVDGAIVDWIVADDAPWLDVRVLQGIVLELGTLSFGLTKCALISVTLYTALVQGAIAILTGPLGERGLLEVVATTEPR